MSDRDAIASNSHIAASVDILSPMVVVGNPISGKGKGARRAEAIHKRLQNAGADVRLAWTQNSGDAERIARDSLEQGARCVVACTMQCVSIVAPPMRAARA